MYQDHNHEKKMGRLPKAAILSLLVLTLVLAGCTGLASTGPMSALDALTYTIYNQGALTPEQMDNVTVLVMLNGDPVIITSEGGQIMLNGEVNITETGIEACNGVIYVIDESLLPPNDVGEPGAETDSPTADVTGEATVDVTDVATAEATDAAQTPVPTDEVTEEPDDCVEGETITDILQADPTFSEFVAALAEAGLLEALDEPGSFTVFAAPNDVFVEPTPGGTPDGTPDGTPGGANQITICHATASDTNPYNEITVDVHGLAGHSRHDGDIIPAPPEGCATGELTATPLPSETAVPTETASPTLEVTPTASETTTP